MILHNLRASTFTDKTFATGKGYSKGVRAIALPSSAAKKKWVRLTLPETGKSTVVQCLDVGPFLWWDDKFILEGNRPLVETLNHYHIPFPTSDRIFPYSRVSFKGKIPSSTASVDLTPEVWQDLGIDKTVEELKTYSNDNMTMEWFVDPR